MFLPTATQPQTTQFAERSMHDYWETLKHELNDVLNLVAELQSRSEVNRVEFATPNRSGHYCLHLEGQANLNSTVRGAARQTALRDVQLNNQDEDVLVHIKP